MDTILNPSLANIHSNNKQTQLEKHQSKTQPLVGSMHRRQDGYGFGGDVPLERNLITEHKVPMQRYPEEYNQPIPGSKSPMKSKNDSQSEKRYELQFKYQSSGVYGSFYKSPTKPLAPAISSFAIVPTNSKKKLDSTK